MIDCATETPNEMPMVVTVGPHTLRVDVKEASGGRDSAPGPHDLFDASLASCKALTAMVYARGHGIPLERVESHVARDDSKERQGEYVLNVRVVFHGPISEEQRARLYDVIERCPIHKLMTAAKIQIATERGLPA